MTNDDGRRAATGEKPRPDGDGKPDGERKTAGGNRWLVGGGRGAGGAPMSFVKHYRRLWVGK
ncbi:hypothetical protein, partial [Burkholderia pseudomallei]|uniref:hypothetical protein n=1 Tax=Burkholderia pseudomallei TaxID=28450 RepID=UPI001C4D39C9